MPSLPINDIVDQLFVTLQSANQVLLQAPPGAGKSTWLPIKLLQQSWLTQRIIMLEPRRLAARNVAQRLAEHLHQPIGQTVGYRMRGANCISKETRLEIVTEGVLTRMLQQDPQLEDVSLIILDEFHERSLQTDLALALLLDIQSGLRDDLKLLIMSATLDNKVLLDKLPEAVVLSSVGRSYPVERYFHSLPAQSRFSDAIAVIVRRMLAEEHGSLLLFLPGVTEIYQVRDRLSEMALDSVDLCPLYGALSLQEQQKAIQPAVTGRRKVVLATNIAETSLTIEGIRLVIDCGLERVARFDSKSGLTRLTTARISKASMIQRAGRAGRIAPGICWHLLAKEQAERAVEQSSPEILQADLASLYLEVLNWGCQEVSQLNWITSPPLAAIQAAKSLLNQLGAIDGMGAITTKGRQMGALGCDPRLAAMLIYSKELDDNAVATAALLAAIIEEPPRGDRCDICDWLQQPRPHWQQRAQQLSKRLGVAAGQVDLQRAPYLLFAAFADRLALQRGTDGRYLLANGFGASIDLSEALVGQRWLIVPSLLQGANTANVRILLATSIDVDVIGTYFPEAIVEQTSIEWDQTVGSLRTFKRQQIGHLVLRSHSLAKPSKDELRAALLNWVKEQGIDQLNWDESAQQLRIRLARAVEWLPEFSWPAVDDASLLATLEQWLSPQLMDVTSLKELKKVNLAHGLAHLLDWQQKQRLEQLLPTHYIVPTGSKLPVHYFYDRPPMLSVRLQEVFGEQQSPHIADGRIKLVLELLSPARRPLQITSDLAAFWQGAYGEVKKEMKGRYPKHVWPDDPANAPPTSRSKRLEK